MEVDTFMSYKEIIISAIISFGKYFLSGGATVSKEIEEARFVICESNTCGKFITSHNICDECKCFMRIKTKLPDARCPLNPPKWDVVIVGDRSVMSNSNSDIDGTVKISGCCGDKNV